MRPCANQRAYSQSNFHKIHDFRLGTAQARPDLEQVDGLSAVANVTSQDQQVRAVRRRYQALSRKLTLKEFEMEVPAPAARVNGAPLCT